jgi:hypothetical protein
MMRIHRKMDVLSPYCDLYGKRIKKLYFHFTIFDKRIVLIDKHVLWTVKG